MLNVLRKLRTFIRTAYTTRKCASVTGPVQVNARSHFSRQTHLGSNVHFNGMTVSGNGSVYIGDNFHSGPGCLIITENHNIHGTALPYDHTYIIKQVIIEDNVWLGSRVIVLGGVTIGEGAVIQAGSCVVNDIPPLSIAGGHPAKVFNKRDEEHYYRLKAEKKFH